MSNENANRLKDISTRLGKYMDKIESGEVDVTEEHFDIVDKLENVVSEYEKDRLNVFNEKNQKIKQIEEEAKRKAELLKSDLVKNLGAFYEVK